MKKTPLYSVLMGCFIFSGCAVQGISKNSVELTQKVEKSDLSAVEMTAPDYEAINPTEEITGFSLQLLRQNFNGENQLISPLSIVSALGMTANGAEGETLSQMKSVLGTEISTLNDYLKAYREQLPQGKNYKVSLADSIWFKDTEDFTAEEDFLKSCKDYYKAEVFKAPFDKSTMQDINSWVKKETGGMIQEILEQPPDKDSMMYLISALSFEAEWQKVYKENQIQEGEFVNSQGKKEKAEMMYSSEYAYLETENATGFIKPYKEGEYAFIALLPDENVKMEVFLKSLSGDHLMRLLEEYTEEEVNAMIPKFSTESELLLNDSLKEMGMTQAFDGEQADFSKLGHSEEGNIYINKVIHKTKIEVQEKGTKAGAATVVEMTTEAALESQPKAVYLNRPFFYMIVDTTQNFPLFMGNLMSLEEKS